MNTTSLSILDSEFLLLTAQAAIELDNAILGRAVTFVSIRQLAGFLKEALDSEACPNTASIASCTLNFDSNALAVLGGTFDILNNRNPIKTVPELVTEAWKLAGTLENSSQADDRSNLERMRSFCVALGTAVASYRQSIPDAEVAHPNRA